MADPEPPKPFLLPVYVEPTPSPSDPVGADEFYKALGILIVAWGRLEGHFVTCLLTLLAAPGGSSLGVNVPPQWIERSKIWRKAFETFPALQGMRASALEFLVDIENAASDRHAIVHALWERFDRDQPPSIGIVSIKKKSGVTNGLDIKRASINLTTLREIANKISELNLRLMTFSLFVTEWRRQEAPPPSDIRRI